MHGVWTVVGINARSNMRDSTYGVVMNADVSCVQMRVGHRLCGQHLCIAAKVKHHVTQIVVEFT